MAAPEPAMLMQAAASSAQSSPRADCAQMLGLANTYCARNLALTTLLSVVCVLLQGLCTAALRKSPLWMCFQAMGVMLGLAIWPGVQLFVFKTKTKRAAPRPVDLDASQVNAAELDAETATAPRTRLRRTWLLRCFELVVVVQCVWLALVVAFVLVRWLLLAEHVTLATTASRMQVAGVFAAIAQIRAFDALRTHHKLQMGKGLRAHVTDALRSRAGSASRLSASRRPSDSEIEIETRTMDDTGKTTVTTLADPLALRFDSSAAIVMQVLRPALYQAAATRDHSRAKQLLEAATLALGSAVKLELLLLRMYSTPTLWFGVFAFTKLNPLHVACRMGDLEMVELLLASGLNPNFMDKIAGSRPTLRTLYEWTQLRFQNATNVLGVPLHVAVRYGRQSLVEVLVARGASLDVVARTSFFSQSMRVTPIFLADTTDVLHELIRHGANTLIVPGKGTAMSITVLQRARLRGRQELASMLEEFGADVALTPLHEAAAAGDIATVKHLLSWGIAADQFGEFQIGANRRTPLHWASVMGRRAVIQTLVQHRADVNARDRHDRTPLHWATRLSHTEAVEALLEAGASVTAVDADGLSPLAFGVLGGLVSAACVRLFVRHGVDVNAALPIESQETCLHVALRHGHQDAAVALIEAGSSITAEDGEGRHAIECCSSADLQYVVKKAANWVDVVISYDPRYYQFADRVRDGIESHGITVYMRDPANPMDDETPYQITQAIVLVCILFPEIEQNTRCMEELTCAKEHQVPVVPISCDPMECSKELQLYVFTRQIIPFEDAVLIKRLAAGADEEDQGGVQSYRQSANRDTSDGLLEFVLDEAQFTTSLQNLTDGLRHVIALRRQSSSDLARQPSLLSTDTSAATYSNSDRGSTPIRESSYTARSLGDLVSDIMSMKLVSTRRRRASTAIGAPSTVFLSHGDCHRTFVKSLYKELRKHDVPVTLDSMDNVLTMRERIVAAKDAILQCDVFVVVLSEESLQTELVNDQLAFAENQHKSIMPVYFAKPPKGLNTTLRERLRGERPMLIFDTDLSYRRGLSDIMQALRDTDAHGTSGASDSIHLPRHVQEAGRRMLDRVRNKPSSAA